MAFKHLYGYIKAVLVNTVDPWTGLYTGGKPRNYHKIVLTQICSQATSGTRRGSFQAKN